jgi:hypothetical protein
MSNANSVVITRYARSPFDLTAMPAAEAAEAAGGVAIVFVANGNSVTARSTK